MRFLCYNLLFTDILGVLDEIFIIFDEAATMLWILLASWAASASVTMILALNHFRKVKIITLKMERHGFRRFNEKQDRETAVDNEDGGILSS